MKITKEYLKRIIKEEYNAMEEMQYSGPKALPRDLGAGATASGDEVLATLKAAYDFCFNVANPGPGPESIETIRRKANKLMDQLKAAREIVYNEKVKDTSSRY